MDMVTNCVQVITGHDETRRLSLVTRYGYWAHWLKCSLPMIFDQAEYWYMNKYIKQSWHTNNRLSSPCLVSLIPKSFYIHRFPYDTARIFCKVWTTIRTLDLGLTPRSPIIGSVALRPHIISIALTVTIKAGRE